MILRWRSGFDIKNSEVYEVEEDIVFVVVEVEIS